MKSFSRVVSGAGILSASEAVVQICTLLRNVVVVRALTQSEYGFAATFALIVAMIDSAGNMMIGGLLIASRDGDEPRFQGAAHVVRFLQGVVQATAIYLLAPIFAAIFHAPEAAAHYRLLAWIPLLQGLSHFDTERAQRELRYAPTAAADSLSHVGALLVTVVLARSIQDYTLVLYGVLVRPVLFCVMTHWMARRRYRWALDRAYARRILSFGWPLVVNGMFMLVVSQGDRFLIGSAESVPGLLERLGIGWEGIEVYDKKDLAVYSIAITIATIPTLFIASIVPPVLLPLLARSRGDAQALDRNYGLAMSALAPLAAGIAVFFILLGGPATTLLYSERYASVGGLVGLLGLASAIRLLRMVQSSTALSQAETRIVLHGNVSRSLALIGFAAIVVVGGPLEWIAFALIGGELLALGVTTLELRRHCGIRAWSSLRPLLFVAPAALGAHGIAALDWAQGDLQALASAGLYMLVVVAVALAVHPELRIRVADAFHDARAAEGGSV